MRLRLTTAQNVRKSLSKVANAVANEEMDCKIANTIIYASNCILQSIRIDEMDARLTKLEKLLDEEERRV